MGRRRAGHHQRAVTRTLLLLDDAPILGGAEFFALKLARWLADERSAEWRSTVATPVRSEFAERSRLAGIPVEPVPFPALAPRAALAMPGALRRLANVLREARDCGTLVVANTARAQAYAAAARLLVRHPPVVVNLVHEQETAARRSAQLVLRRVGHVVAVGANNAAVYQRALPGCAIGRLNNILMPQDLGAAVARRRDQRRAGPPTVGVIARLIPEKGVLELVDELASRPDSWHELRVAAPPQDPAYTARLRGRIGALGLDDRVALLGRVDDVPAFLGGIGVLVVPSTGNEGQPTVILEALAAGVPVVVRRPVWSSDFDGLPVASYETPGELAVALAASPEPTGAAELERRFGPDQALAALEAAAEAAT